MSQSLLSAGKAIEPASVAVEKGCGNLGRCGRCGRRLELGVDAGPAPVDLVQQGRRERLSSTRQALRA